MLELRHSTTVLVKIGVVVNSTGVTPVTTLTIDAADEAEILKHGTTGTLAISGTLTAITNCDGWYYLSLSASDTGTLGPLTIAINDDSACLPIYRDFHVINAKFYDYKYGDDAGLNVNIQAISGDTASADNLEAAFDGTGYAGGTILQKVDCDAIRGVTATATDLKDFADTGYDPVTHKVETVKTADVITTYTGNTPQTGDAYAIVNDGTYGNSAIETLVDDIESRLTAARAGYLDNLSAGAVAQDSTVAKMTDVVEGTITVKQALALVLSVLTGKSSGGGTATLTFRDTGDTKNRLVVTVDTDGNRTAVGTRDGS